MQSVFKNITEVDKQFYKKYNKRKR